jgi:rare lipoprotein A
LAERYAARHAAWHAKKRSHLRPKRKQLLPAAAALTVAGLIVGSAGAAMQLHSTGDPKADSTFAYDPADFPPPDRNAAQDRVSRGGARTVIAPTTTATATAATAQQQPSGAGSIVSAGSCEASFYDEPQGTASGEVFNPEAFTAANKTLPFNTRVRVTNIANGKSVIVRINDRGPYVSGRCLDLSRASFRAIASLSTGVVDVRYEVLA